nr:F-box only protein 39-like isoform X1 [Procambarus clarkii]
MTTVKIPGSDVLPKIELWNPTELGLKVAPRKVKFQKENKDDPDHVYSNWHILPDLLLENIFQYLTLSQRYSASMVCRNWYEAFYFPRVWYTFELHDTLLTKRKFNYCAGWQKLLDHIRVTIFLTKKGMHIRTLIFPPMSNLFNLYEFLNVSLYMHNNCPGTLDNVHTLRFRFACQQTERSEEVVYGTGGQILAMFKKVMGVLPLLRTLELRDLLLDGHEGLELLDEVCVTCCETLRTLILINITKLGHTLLHPGAFVNLKTLFISPQNIGEDLLELLAYSKVRNMYIVQNKYTDYGRSLSYKAWKLCRAANPRLRVHLCNEGSSKDEIIWQQHAPVKSIVYDNPYARVTTPVIPTIIDLYKQDLEVYAHKQLPRFHMPRSFQDRIDSSLVLLIRQCPYIHTLVIREKISTATVLLVAYTAKNLHYYYIRRNAIILKADWPCNPDWTPEFCTWLCKNARSYETMEHEVSQILGYRWQALTDKQFKMIKIDFGKPHFMYS